MRCVWGEGRYGALCLEEGCEWLLSSVERGGVRLRLERVEFCCFIWREVAY